MRKSVSHTNKAAPEETYAGVAILIKPIYTGKCVKKCKRSTVDNCTPIKQMLAYHYPQQYAF